MFGSRADDNAKGGDIDILVFSEQNLYTLANEIIAKFKQKLDAKLDVLVIDKQNTSKEQQAFLNTLTLLPL